VSETRAQLSEQQGLFPAPNPRLAFVGVGWIGFHRMKALVDSGQADVCAILEPQAELAERAQRLAPDAAVVSDFNELLANGADGVVIATPSAMHSEQAIAAAENGLAVFCQKPLGIHTRETARAINAARTANRLLHIDLCYRFLEGVTKIRRLIHNGELGEIYSADFVFHNAYGPDKAWFYDPRLSGGGCLIDLGIHLVDLALWFFDFQRVAQVSASLFAHGRPFAGRNVEVEDFADARLRFESGAVARVSCSWRAHAGRDALIEFSLYGTKGGVALRNVNGSFYDFVSEHYTGTSHRVLSTPPDDWGGRAAMNWLTRLRESNDFDPAIENLNAVASVLDRIYAS